MEALINFDLDGVLANFVEGALRLHNRSDFPMIEVGWDFHKQIEVEPVTFWAGMGYDFWRNLPPLDDGMELLRNVSRVFDKDRIAILTSPCDTSGCYEGKRDWVKVHLPGYEKRLFTAKAKHLAAAPHKVLVDDSLDNIEKWEAEGGKAVMVPRPWNPYKTLTFDPRHLADEVLRQAWEAHRDTRSCGR